MRTHGDAMILLYGLRECLILTLPFFATILGSVRHIECVVCNGTHDILFEHKTTKWLGVIGHVVAARAGRLRVGTDGHLGLRVRIDGRAGGPRVAHE